MRPSLKLLGSTAAVAMAAAVNPVSALAQDAEESDQQVEENIIVVTGTYAESLKVARDKKRDSAVVIEAISISDLSQLPDVSIADALSRLPGISANRDSNNGAKSTISIRGMGSQLSLGMLNGRDLATAAPSRDIRYDQFPSELIGGAVVYKSPMASIVEGGMAGSIDLATVKPLDYKENLVTADLRGVYNQMGDQFSRGEAFGVRGSASFIGKFADDTLGIAVGYAGRDEPYNVLRTQHASYDPTGYTDFNGDGAVDNTTYLLTQFARTGRDERHGIVGVVEWEPSSDVHLTIDSLWSKVKLDGTISGVYADRVSQQFANVYTDTVVEDNHLVAATVTGRPPSQAFGFDMVVQNVAAISRRDDKLFSLGGNLEFSPDGPWTAIVDAAYSRVRYQADYWEIRTIPVAMQNGVLAPLEGQSLSYDARTEVPTFGNLNFDLTDPSINRPATLTAPLFELGKDDIYSFKTDFIYTPDSDWLTGIRLGMRFVDRTKQNTDLTQSLTLAINDRPILSEDEILSFAPGSYDGRQTGASPEYLTFDFDTIADRYFGGLNPGITPESQAASWVVTERTMAGYGQADFEYGRLLGNVGLRVIQTDDTSSSVRRVFTATTPDTLEPFTAKNSYTDFLPSLNLTYEASDSLQFRLGLAKTIARPSIDDLNAGFQAFDFGVPQAFGGNPELEPFRANQVDLSAEYYFGEGGLFAVTGFYKDLKTYITTATQQVDIDGVTYEFFQPVNGNGGSIKGFEVTFQKQFSELPEPFDGFGVYANYAFVDSSIEVSRNFSDNVLGLIGLSKHTGTATIYYYKNGFEARASYNYRSSNPFVVDGGGFETVDDAGYLDGQISYEFLDGFSVILQGVNLTNTANRTYLGNSTSQRGRFEEFGRTFYAGVRAQF